PARPQRHRGRGPAHAKGAHVHVRARNPSRLTCSPAHGVTLEAMRRKDLETLFGFSYWMKDRVLECAAKLTTAEFQAPSGFTTRDLRGTLVHTLDVESSWRARLQHKPEAEWKKELAATDYPRAAALIDHWRRDEREMRAWLATLDDETLQQIHDLAPGSPPQAR